MENENVSTYRIHTKKLISIPKMLTTQLNFITATF